MNARTATKYKEMKDGDDDAEHMEKRRGDKKIARQTSACVWEAGGYTEKFIVILKINYRL